jgi:hypothetical protein
LNRSQFVTGSQKHRDPKFPPFAFTEHGAIMAATVLNSPRAVEMSVYVVRAFVQLRELLASNTILKSLASHLYSSQKWKGRDVRGTGSMPVKGEPHARLRHDWNQ